MIDKEISYWQPRVMRHHKKNGQKEYAMHEVFFDKNDEIDGYTMLAVSPRKPSVNMLKARLIELLEESENGVSLGDLGYIHHTEDIQLWLEYIDEPVVDYGEDEVTQYEPYIELLENAIVLYQREGQNLNGLKWALDQVQASLTFEVRQFRSFFLWAEGQLDMIQFTVNDEKQHQEVLKVVTEVESELVRLKLAMKD